MGKKHSSHNFKEILDIVEKPNSHNIPSNMAVVGRYIFEPEIFNHIKNKQNSKKEIELTDAVKSFIDSGEKIYIFSKENVLIAEVKKDTLGLF